MVSRIVWLLVVMASLYTLKLVDWNQGFDAGYGMGMADAFFDEALPGKFFKKFSGVHR